MVIGVSLNLLGVLQCLLLIDNIYFPLTLFIFWLISLCGIILSAFKLKTIGPIFVIIGSLPFIPLGLIALFGSRKILDSIKRAEFDNC